MQAKKRVDYLLAP